jgi:hypothetical protein
MDTVINMADAEHALDLARIRFQLMYALPQTPPDPTRSRQGLTRVAVLRIQSLFI